MSARGAVRLFHSTYTKLLILIALLLPQWAMAQGIFSELTYDESYIRSKIEQYSISVDSLTGSSQIPENIYYQLVFREILSDSYLLGELSEADALIVQNLPAHEDSSFLGRDHEELTALCLELADSAGGAVAIQQAADQFDNSRARREQDLNTHYAQVVEKLSVDGKSLVLDLLSEFITTKHIAYSTFDMSGLAADEPGIAHAILINGCVNFESQVAGYTPKTVKLREQLYTVQAPDGQ